MPTPPAASPPGASPAAIPAALAKALRDRYRLDRVLGQGGMGVVYLAHDLRHERPVALKVFLPGKAGDLGEERFRREIRVTAALQHPHILPVFDSGISAGQWWYTMPYVAGESLRRRLERETRLPINEAVGLAWEIADALAAAHASGIVHRDIKPENVLLSGGHALVADFGVARLAGPAEPVITGGGVVVGSPAYMSPEQVAGDQLDGRSDVYSLGCVLFEMLTGTPPFAAKSAMLTMSRRMVEPPPDPLELRPETPPWLGAVVQRALARDLAERFPSAAEMKTALDEAGGATTVTTTTIVASDMAPDRSSTLVEREEFRRTLERRLAAAAVGNGSLVVVSGEAGIGKTSLVDEFTRAHPETRVLWGWCEALFTPRPLGPLHDIAAQMGGALDEALRQGAPRETVFSALLGQLGDRTRPTVLVLEDVHWADEATLDLLKFLGRRANRLPLLAVVTVRDEIGPTHSLRTVLGDLPRGAVHRLELTPLSAEAVTTLAERAGRSDSGLHAATGGNPFYLTEVLATSQPGIPATVRDAVLGRAARVSPAAREAMELISVIPGKAEPALVDRLFGREATGVDEAMAAGMLVADPHGVAFRHELARRAVEESLALGRRRALHVRAFVALDSMGDVAHARLVHHAEAAGDADAVLRHAPIAAARASALGAHREASAHYRVALQFADALSDEQRATLLEGLSYEQYLIGCFPDSIAPLEEALATWRTTGDGRREGAALRWRSRLAWSEGHRADAERYGEAAIAALEPLGPSRELAMAYSNRSQLHMLAGEAAPAVAWGDKAIALAEQVGDREILTHALTNVGSAEMRQDGRQDKLTRALRLALEGGWQEHVSRCYANFTALIADRDYRSAVPWMREGLEYTESRDLDFWTHYLRSWMAVMFLDTGRWADAEREAEGLLAQDLGFPPAEIHALIVLGALRGRRGEPGSAAMLDMARDLAARTAELQRIGPVAVARAEAAWLAGDRARIAEEARGAYALSEGRNQPWMRGLLAVWLRRAGALEQVPDGVPTVCALELAGDFAGAAGEWARIGCPFERALVLAASGVPGMVDEAITVFEGLGARGAVAAIRR